MLAKDIQVAMSVTNVKAVHLKAIGVDLGNVGFVENVTEIIVFPAFLNIKVFSFFLSWKPGNIFTY